MYYIQDMQTKPLHTVVETLEFLRQVRGLLKDDEKHDLISYVAANTDAGDVISGTGGARKLRWAAGDKGKSGGVRVITFYSGPPIPVFLLAVFAKKVRINLSQAERNDLRKVLKQTATEYVKRS